MKRSFRRAALGEILGIIGLVVPLTWAQAASSTATPPPAAMSKLERLRIAVAPLGWDTNYTWLQSRSGQLDKRPALEYLVGIDRYTGAYIPELAETWEMAPDGKTWTITLRKGVKFHEHWGEFTAKDVRHAVFLITQPDSIQSDASAWRTVMGVEATDTPWPRKWRRGSRSSTTTRWSFGSNRWCRSSWSSSRPTPTRS